MASTAIETVVSTSIETHSARRGSAERIPELDGLRGIAIFLVLGAHFINVTNGPRWAAYFQNLFLLGWSGVDLFFVLSGFLIGGILLDVRSSRSYFKTFYARRFFRIIPIYYIWVTLYLLLVALGTTFLRAHTRTGTVPPLGFDIYAHYLFLQNFAIVSYIAISEYWLAHTWSLAVEEQFYLVAPLFVRLLTRRRLSIVLGLLIFSAPLIRLFVRSHFAQGPWLGYRLMPCRADSLACGMLAAILWRNESFREWLTARGHMLYGLIGVLSAGMLVLWKWFPNPQSPLTETVGFTWIAVFYLTILVLALSRPVSAIATVCRLPWLRELGKVSYAVYIIHTTVNLLFHMVLLHAAPQTANLKGAAVTLLAVFGTYGIARISWEFLEHPLLRRGHTFKY
jgi:peptidoglycan/LPS O-acetylase OafA/YrhL